MPLAFSEGQLEQIKTFAYQLPRHLCSQYLHHLAQADAPFASIAIGRMASPAGIIATGAKRASPPEACVSIPLRACQRQVCTRLG